MDLIMIMDMTYLEIKEIKSNIKQFLDEIQKIAQIQQFEYAQKDHDFFLLSLNILSFLNICIREHKVYIFIKC